MRIRAVLVCVLFFGPAACVSSHQRIAPDISLSNPALVRIVNRTAVSFREGDRRGLRLDERSGQGVAWIEGIDFDTGIIEVETRGRDLFQRSFVGVAFHGISDDRYEVIYLRPFNFRADDSIRRSRAIQYIAEPEFPWSRLRSERPGEFERGLEPAPRPEAWVHLRVEVQASRVRAFVNRSRSPALDVPRLAALRNGRVGIWVGDASGGDFANLRIERRQRPG